MARETKAVLTNMCMVCDGDYILVQDKINFSYTGVTFPGGHAEPGETLTQAVILPENFKALRRGTSAGLKKKIFGRNHLPTAWIRCLKLRRGIGIQSVFAILRQKKSR